MKLFTPKALFVRLSLVFCSFAKTSGVKAFTIIAATALVVVGSAYLATSTAADSTVPTTDGPIWSSISPSNLSNRSSLLPVPLTSCGGAGGVDASFGTGGTVITPVVSSGILYSIARQSDGKIVAAGSGFDGSPAQNGFMIVRYNIDGSLDNSFGTGGKVRTPVNGGFASSVAIQSDGKIVAAGRSTGTSTGSDFAIIRYNTDGSLDSSFGTAGIATVDISSGDEAHGVAIQPDGKIVAAGGSSGDFAVVRVNADGSTDTSFDGDGKVTTAVGNSGDLAFAVALQSDGKILAGGREIFSPTSRNGLVRYNTDGSLDTSFGGTGIVTTSLAFGYDEIRALIVQLDGKIVAVGGNSGAVGTQYISLVRHNTDGSLDTAFGTGGKVITTSAPVAYAVALQGDGKIITAGGGLGSPNNEDFATARYNTDGSLDTSFGNNGIAFTPVSTGGDRAYAALVQPDGKIVVGGQTQVPISGGTTAGFGLARLQVDGCEIAVEGPTGTGLTDGSSTVNFGDGTVNMFGVPRTFTIRNVGTQPMPIGAITVDGPHAANFSVSTTGTTSPIAPGGSTTFTVSFSPSAPGTRTAALHIANDDLTENPFDINLTGRGLTGANLTLNVTAVNGSVTSAPAGINCPTDCSEGFPEGAETQVALTATANPGYQFAGWSGDATGTANPLTVSMTANRNITALFQIPAACGNPALLDNSFGTNGIVTTTLSGTQTSLDRGSAMVIQPDGKIVVAGSYEPTSASFAVVRYNADGSLDNSFGTGGKVITNLPGSSNSRAYSVALQSDGKIVAAGSSTQTNEDFAIVRYNGDGSLDSTFGTGGIVTTPIGSSNDYAYSISIQPDGKIIAAGSMLVSGVNDDFAVARYNADGSLDTSFGTGGKVTTAVSANGSDIGRAVRVQSDGRIVVGGWGRGSFTDDFAVVRYNANGTRDNSFGTGGNGIVTTPVSGNDNDLAHSLAIDPDGKILLAGSAGGDYGLVRYQFNGALDTSFGSGGRVVTAIGTSVDEARAVALSPDGKILAAGRSRVGSGSNDDLSVIRYKADGSLDLTFNGTGKVLTSFSNSLDIANAIAVQPDGKIVAAGTANNNDFAVVRYVGVTCEIAVEGPNSEPLADGGSTVDFGVRPVGSAGTAQTFTIRNTGVTTFALGAVTVDGAAAGDFAVNTAGMSTFVAPNGSATFTVTFTPGGAGTRNAVLRIANNDLDENPFDINLTGRGISGVTFPLNVTTANGRVVSSPAGINCPGDCSENVDEGAVVNLTAIPDIGYRFTGWTGDVTGSNINLSVTMNAAKNVTASFAQLPTQPVMFDYDGDRRADISIRRPNEIRWYLLRSTAGYTAYQQCCASSDKMAPADYDGDGKFDLAVYRNSGGNGIWNILRSSDQVIESISWGLANDIPMSADRNADGRAELVLFRPSTNTWFTRFSATNIQSQQFGEGGDKPLVGDFDRDGIADNVIYRPANFRWYLSLSANGFTVTTWGEAGDIPVPADYDGDGATDIAVWRPSTGRWYIIGSTAGWMNWFTWGEPADRPAPADYDGDGKTDIAVWRPSTGTWYIINSADYSITERIFGVAGDVPTPGAYIY